MQAKLNVKMAKAQKKTNPKKDDPKHVHVEAEKKQKIAKKSKAQEGAAKKPNPSAGGPKAQKLKRTPVVRNYFTLGEDLQIYDTWKSAGSQPVSNVAKKLAHDLGRSVEAIRDRLKRYITKMNAVDQKELQQQAKKNPKFYIHFKANADKTKKIEKVSPVAPALQNRQFNRRPRVSKKKIVPKVPKKVPLPDEKFKWVAEKLQNKDSYFKLEFSVQLLADILNVLIQNEGVSPSEVEKVIGAIHYDQNLNDILTAFKIKNK